MPGFLRHEMYLSKMVINQDLKKKNQGQIEQMEGSTI